MMNKVGTALVVVILLVACAAAADTIYRDDFTDPAWTMANWDFRGGWWTDCTARTLNASVHDGLLELQGTCSVQCDFWAIFHLVDSEHYKIRTRAMMKSNNVNENLAVLWHFDADDDYTRAVALLGGGYPGGHYAEVSEAYHRLCAGGHSVDSTFYDWQIRWYDITLDVKQGSTPDTDSLYYVVDADTVLAIEFTPSSPAGRTGLGLIWANTAYFDWFEVTLSSPTANQPATWGAVKALYR